MDTKNKNTEMYVRKTGFQEARNNETKNLNITPPSSCDDSSSESSEDSVPGAPDGGWGWMVVFASFIAHLIADGCGFSIGILFTEWLDVFGESKAKTAFVSSLFVSMPAICGPVASIITNKFGCRLTTAAGGFIAAFGCLLSSFANSIDVLCITFGVIAGFGLALVYVPVVVVVAFYFEKRRAFATGIAVAGSGIGTFIFAPLTDLLIKTYSWRGAMIIIGGIMLNIIVCGALFRPLVSLELRKKRTKYLRSLERFSRASSRRQSKEGIDRRSQFDDECTNDDTNSKDLISHSLILLPTYASSYNGFSCEQRDLHFQGRQNSKSHTDLPYIHILARDCQDEYTVGCVNESENKKEETSNCNHATKNDEKELQKTILSRGKKPSPVSQNGFEGKRKKIRFPEHLVPRQPTDIFYRGSLLRAGFLLNRGQSASCPDIFVHANKRHSLHARFQSMTFSRIFNKIRDVSDYSIFKDRMFLFFCVHSMLLYVSYDIPYVYIPSKARNYNISDEWASFLVSIVGIVSTVGQVVMGYLGDRSWINVLYFYIAMITVAGLATLVVPALTSFATLAAYCGVFGFFISANFALTTVIVVELLGMDQLTNAYGFISLAEGLANLAGPPFAGWVIDSSGSDDLAFYLAGIVICISGLMLLVVPCMRKCRSLFRTPSSSASSEDPEVFCESSN